MKSKLRRYEVLLPVRFNDGKNVPEELLAEAVNEIVAQFHAVTFYKQAIEGQWQHEDRVYRDDLALLAIDVGGHHDEPQVDEGIQGEMEKTVEAVRDLDGQLPGRY